MIRVPLPRGGLQDGKATEFSFTDIHRYGNLEKVLSTLCNLASSFSGTRPQDILKERTADLQKLIQNRIKRIEKKEALQHEELDECKKKDKYRLYGELLTANLYRLKQGEEKCVCLDWCTGKDVEIPLDKRLSPSKNAEGFFKKYRKLSNAEKVIVGQLAESRAEREYLETVLDNVNRCESMEEAENIRRLVLAGYLRKRTNPAQRGKTLWYKTAGGFTVQVGKNNLMNTPTKSAGKNDLWFHVKDFPGSHILYRWPGTGTMTTPGRLCCGAPFVGGKQNIQVDYTRVKNIKSPTDQNRGMLFTINTTPLWPTAVNSPSSHPIHNTGNPLHILIGYFIRRGGVLFKISFLPQAVYK